jgi:hypothetical protein
LILRWPRIHVVGAIDVSRVETVDTVVVSLLRQKQLPTLADATLADLVAGEASLPLDVTFHSNTFLITRTENRVPASGPAARIDGGEGKPVAASERGR